MSHLNMRKIFSEKNSNINPHTQRSFSVSKLSKLHKIKRNRCKHTREQESESNFTVKLLGKTTTTVMHFHKNFNIQIYLAILFWYRLAYPETK